MNIKLSSLILLSCTIIVALLSVTKYFFGISFEWFCLIILILLSTTFWIGNRDVDLFHPGVAFPLVYTFLYGMGFFYLWLNNDAYSGRVIFFSVIGLLAYQVGVYIISGRFKLRQVLFFNDLNLSIFYFLLYITAGLSFLAAMYIYSKIGIPILAVDIFHIRDEGYSEVSHYSLYLLRNIGLVFNLSFLVLFASKNHVTTKVKVISFLVFMIAFLMMFSTASRADMMFLFVLFLVNYHYSVKKISLIKSIAVTAFLIVAAIGYNYYRMFQFAGTHETLSYLSQRFNNNHFYMFLYHMLAQVSLLGVTFRDVVDKIPEYLPYFYGSIIPITLSTFLPGHQAPPGELLKEKGQIVFTGGQSNLTLLGDFYADFGTIGIIAGMLLLGVVVSWLYTRLYRKQTLSLLMIYTYVEYSLIVGLPGGLLSQAIRYYYLFIILVFIFVSKSLSKVLYSGIRINKQLF